MVFRWTALLAGALTLAGISWPPPAAPTLAAAMGPAAPSHHLPARLAWSPDEGWRLRVGPEDAPREADLEPCAGCEAVDRFLTERLPDDFWERDAPVELPGRYAFEGELVVVADRPRPVLLVRELVPYPSD